MGQTLSEPITTKHTESCHNQYLKVGSSSMQGWRINMEDSHTHILALPDDPDAAFFGVYDGHGGNYFINNQVLRPLKLNIEFNFCITCL